MRMAILGRVTCAMETIHAKMSAVKLVHANMDFFPMKSSVNQSQVSLLICLLAKFKALLK